MATSSKSNLLDEALGYLLDDAKGEGGGGRVGRMIVVEDCVETCGAFVLHHLLKRSLSPYSFDAAIFISLARPFSHYERILRKLGCNLAAQREKKRLLFFEMLMLESLARDKGKTSDDLFVALYGEIHKAVEICSSSKGLQRITIIIDDFSLMEVDANGSSDIAIDFLHYLYRLSNQFGCLLVILNHEDVYETMDRPTTLLQLEYLADVVIKVEPLATGLSSDVHGLISILNRGLEVLSCTSWKKISSFQFRIKDSGTEYFYPGS